MHVRKNFIPRNEGFMCEQCGRSVPPAKGTFRNHCPFCLTSKHVDEVIPGDRASACGGAMLMIDAAGTAPENLDLIQQCQRCDKIIRNRLASDDDINTVFKLLKSRAYAKTGLV